MAGEMVVLNSGGLKSLVATATLGRAAAPILLFVHDGRASAAEHHHAFLQQAQHFEASRRIELAMTHLHAPESGAKPGPLVKLNMVTAAALQAARLGADTLIWPVRVGDDFAVLSMVAEACILLEHAAEHETGRRLNILTPLLELSLEQVIEVGAQHDVPWRLGRSCVRRSASPCGKCEACVERERAMSAAGVQEPGAPVGQG